MTVNLKVQVIAALRMPEGSDTVVGESPRRRLKFLVFFFLFPYIFLHLCLLIMLYFTNSKMKWFLDFFFLISQLGL